ncbi:MAG: glycerophosphodiester phosphodiesterase family protein [Sphaerochaetaceae bacterium]|jgi:glycerophosphoryl diester phosphodiesterase|nr:glycerophosphodiester phosphodiesterase family protein [Sphaerochaetaceae bacterium]
MKGFFDYKEPLVYGHRGFSAKAPENTMVSFDMCLSEHIPGIELDIHLSADNKLYVIHDSSLRRTCNIDAAIEDLDAGQISKADPSFIKKDEYSGLRIPLLEEVLSSFGPRFIYDIELKWSKDKKRNRLLCQSAIDMVRACKLEDHVSFSCFNPLVLATLNSISHGAFLSADIFSHEDHIPRILHNGLGHIVSHSSYEKPDYRIVDEAFMKKQRRPIVAWTVNDEQSAKAMKSLGVAGIISNDPAMVLKA